MLILLKISFYQLRIFLENYKSEQCQTRSDNNNYGSDEGSFTDDMDYVLETMQYVYDLKLGKAEIRPVIEEARKVRQYWWRCHLKMPAVVAGNEWFQNDDFHVYSATYDRRLSSLYPNNHVVQVLVMSFRSIPLTEKVFCNLYDIVHEQYAVIEGTIREIWQRAWDPRDFFYIPSLISCPVPKYFEQSTNLAISLSKTPCKSQEISSPVRILPSRKEKSGIAVCVKGLDYLEDIPERLVEWIEMQFITGADMITIYTYYVPRKMQEVLNYYIKQGFVTVIPIKLPGKSPNQAYIRSYFIWRNRQQKRRHELIPYNDCLYRHIDTHKFVLMLDIDEIVVPLENNSWSAILDNILGRNLEMAETTSISIRNVFKFPSDIGSSNPVVPSYMYMLRNRRRSETLSKPGEYGKAFINTNTVATVFNHFALHRQRAGVAKTLYVEPDVAIKLHYKAKCPMELGKQCEQLENVTVDDITMDRYAEQLTGRVTKVLRHLHIIE
ncbi:unnamed protein product [Litomosoides sigmodontis]|uniref:Glycosyltransferase family 92 protein n=1 Tax=Litomosoides sigmodontis TaxID=42156 RepID=A0A3P6SGD4_LITSI|nr:unnamed protein product [Litomosoides sigmodontis]